MKLRLFPVAPELVALTGGRDRDDHEAMPRYRLRTEVQSLEQSMAIKSRREMIEYGRRC
jgi:hypothetical protein